MDEILLSRDELIELFVNEDIKDTPDGWLYKNNTLVNIIALHDKNPKYIYNVTSAQYYKISSIELK